MLALMIALVVGHAVATGDSKLKGAPAMSSPAPRRLHVTSRSQLTRIL
jgi:hypothetical protein